MAYNIPGTHGSYAPGSNGLEGFFNYSAPDNNPDSNDPFENISYGDGLTSSGNLFGSTDFSNSSNSFTPDWGYTPDFGGTSYGFNDFSGANDYGLSYDGSGLFPSAQDASLANGTGAWPYDVSSSTDFSANQDPWDKLKQVAGQYNSFMSNPGVKGVNTLLGMTGNTIPGLGYLNLASNAIQNPGGTAVGLGGALAQSALLGPVGGLMNMFGVNLPKMGYDYLNNSYMGEPRYGATAGQMQDAQNQGNFSMSGALQSGLGLGASLAGLYGGIQGARSAGSVANSLGNMFSQNSPYAQQLRQQLERKDAAAGRRSQVGTREVELQARLAGMANQAAPNQLAAQQQRYQQYMTMANNLGKISQLYPQLVKGFSGLSSLFSGGSSPTLDLGNIYGSGASPSYGMNTGFLDSGLGGSSGYDMGGW